MPPEPDAIVHPIPPAIGPTAATVAAAPLHYAPVANGRAVRRWLAGHPVLLVALAVGVAAALSWYGWKWRLKQDEKAFNARAVIGPTNGWIFFNAPPTAAAQRHLQRMPNIRGLSALSFSWSGNPEPDACSSLRGRRFPTVNTFALRGEMDADVWLKEISRPDTGLKTLAALDLWNTKVTDAGLKELARPDTGLAALRTLDLGGTKVTEAGLKELARPDTGLKALTELNLTRANVTDTSLKELAKPGSGLRALNTLYLRDTQVTDASLKELARPDCGLKALSTLYLDGTKVTEAGIAALKAARPGLTVVR